MKLVLLRMSSMCCFAVVVVATSVVAADPTTSSLQPFRGVMTSLRSKYPSTTSSPEEASPFTCFDGSATIPAKFINDDYCDCADGTDEPGTAACTYVAAGLRAPTPDFAFQCANEGFDVETFPHARVNDGMCDCCDGSDEYQSAAEGGVDCPNVCATVTAQRKAAAAERESARLAGLAAKAQLVAAAAAKLEELREEVQRHKAVLASVEGEIPAAQAAKDAAEKIETEEREAIHQKSLAEKAVWDAEQAEKKAKKNSEEEEEKKSAVAAAEQLERSEERSDEEVRGEPLRSTTAEPETDTTVEPEKHDDQKEVEEQEDEEEGEEANKSKLVCTKWRQTGDCRGKDGPRQPASDKECFEVVEPGASGYCECVDTFTNEDVTYPFDCHHRKFRCEDMCAARGEDSGFQKEEAPKTFDFTKHPADQQQPREPEFHVDTGASHTNVAAQDARGKLNELQRKKGEAERGIADAEERLSSDSYGPDHVFLPLKGQCFDKNEGHYTYTLCPFDSVKQGHTNMGSWQSWGEQTYGAWGGKHDFGVMKYERGQSCWSGPQRSTTVRVVCGPENKVQSVDEPSMCTYTMVFQTPAICE